MKKILIAVCLLFISYVLCLGQETTLNNTNKTTHNNKPIISGRVLVDGGLFLNQTDTLKSGVKFTDIRIGIRGTLQDNWFYKIEVGYTGSSISVKDAFFGYRKNNHQIQIGQFFEPFNMSFASGTTDLKFHLPAGVVDAMGCSRKLGLTYQYNVPKFNITAGVFSDNSTNNLKSFNKDYSIQAKFIYRPINDGERLLHLAVSPKIKTVDKELRMISPGVSTLPNKPLISVHLTDAKTQFRLGAEAYASFGKLTAQAEYILTKVWRENSTYFAQGAYAEMAYTILGANSKYDSSWGCAKRPGGKSLQAVVRYNYQNMNDHKSDVMGGELQDISIGLNYYITKYIAVKLNYSYVIPIEEVKHMHDKPFSLIQLRAQVSF